MPKYTTKGAAARKRQRKTISKTVSKDKRILKRWAAQGTASDYAKLRKYATKYASKAPEYVDATALNELQNIDRRRMIENLHNDGGAAQASNPFSDALAWLQHAMPSFGWSTNLLRNSMEGFKGDAITEQDEDYAKLVSATYMDDRPEMVEGWMRLGQYDTEYCSLWVNKDGHAFIAVRGTEFNAKDLLSDVEIAVTGTVPGQDEIVPQIQRMLRDLSPDVMVDAGAHSLGTTLLTRAYEADPQIKKRIRQSFMYNPASSPVPSMAGINNVTQDFIKDPTVRYFINLSDIVSSAFLGDNEIANVVYRSGSALQPMTNHSIDSWYPGDFNSLDTKQVPQLEDGAADTGDPPSLGSDPRFTIQFGTDDWDRQFAQLFEDVTVASTEPTSVGNPFKRASPDTYGTGQ